MVGLRTRTWMIPSLLLACLIPAWPQVPIRPGPPEGARPETPRGPARTPTVTPKRVIRLRPPRKGELPPVGAGATSEPEVAEPPPLRVTEVEDPARVVVATVGSTQLNLKEVQDQLARIRSPLLSGAKEDVERYRRSFARQVASDWVDDNLLALEARTRGIQTTPQEVNRYIEGTAQESGLRVPVAERLRLAGVSEDNFRATVEEAVLGDKLIRQTIRQRVTDVILQDALAKNPLMFWAAPRRRVQQLFHPFQGGEAQSEIRDVESRMKSIRRRLTWFGGQLVDHADNRTVFFQEIWMGAGDRVDAQHQFIYGFIFRLEPPRPDRQNQYVLRKGEISDVVSSPAGLHLFKIVEDQPARRKTIEECRLDVENSFYDQVRSGLIHDLELKHHISRDAAGIFGNALQRTSNPSPRAAETGSPPPPKPPTTSSMPLRSLQATTRTSNVLLPRPTPR